MAVSLLQRHDVSDLCIGKPALTSLPPTATVAVALAALKRAAAGGGDAYVAVWAPERKDGVAGRVCMVDVVLYLCAEENIASPAAALNAPVEVLLSDGASRVRRVEPSSSILEALDAILDGATSLVVPILPAAGSAARRRHPPVAGGDLCWLTAEDLVRFFLNSISLFSATASLSVSALAAVRPASLTVAPSAPALSAVPLLRAALSSHSSVAVLAPGGRLVGELSPSTLASCDESVAAAIAALSATDLMAFVDCAATPPDSTIRAIRSRLHCRGLIGMLELLDGDTSPPLSSSSSLASSSSSSDDEDGKSSNNSNRNAIARSGSLRRMGSYSARMGRRAEEAIVCHPGSSLVAVMIQALAHRVAYVWVVDDDYELVGIVGFVDVLRVLREHLHQSAEPDMEVRAFN